MGSITFTILPHQHRADSDRRCSKPAAEGRDRKNRGQRQRLIVFHLDPSDV